MKFYPALLGAILVLITFVSQTAQAQSSINCSGGNCSSSLGNVCFSIGQPFTAIDRSSQGSVANGVQQPFEVLNVGVSTLANPVTFLVYPNPTTQFITMNISHFAGERLVFRLLDLKGNVVKTQFIYSQQSLIDVTEFAAATYYIVLNSIDGQQVQQAIIIK